MLGYRRRTSALLLAATALTLPIAANAAAPTQRETELEARLLRLEGEMQALKSDLAQAKAASANNDGAQAVELAKAAEAKADATAVKVAALEAKTQPDGFKVGATTFKMGGFVKAVGSVTRFGNGELAGGSLGKEFFLPQQIPVGGSASTDVIGHARQTRLFFSAATPVSGKELKAHIEFDFALAAAPLGAQRATNAYTPTFSLSYSSAGA